MTFHKVMYDYDALYCAWKKFLEDFEMDTVSGPGVVYPARVFDIVDYKLYAWPGHGLPVNATGHEFVEGEYMAAGEYDAFLADPSDYAEDIFAPRPGRRPPLLKSSPRSLLCWAGRRAFYSRSASRTCSRLSRRWRMPGGKWVNTSRSL